MQSKILFSALVSVLLLAACSNDRPNRYRLDLTLDPTVLAATNIPPRFRDRVPGTAVSRVFLPDETSPGPIRRVLAFFGTPGDVARASDRWGPLKDSLAAAAVTIDLAQSEHVGWGEYYYLLHVLRDLKNNGVVARDASIVVAGYGGGAQLALIVGNFGGARQFDAVLAVRATVPMATAGRDDLPNQDALRLPITVLNRGGDRANQGTVDGLRKNGFSRVQLVEYEGDRQFPTRAALESLGEIFTSLSARPGVHR